MSGQGSGVRKRHVFRNRSGTDDINVRKIIAVVGIPAPSGLDPVGLRNDLQGVRESHQMDLLVSSAAWRESEEILRDLRNHAARLKGAAERGRDNALLREWLKVEETFTVIQEQAERVEAEAIKLLGGDHRANLRTLALGTPRVRDLVRTKLAPAFDQHFGIKRTSTVKGPWVAFLVEVFRQLGIVNSEGKPFDVEQMATLVKRAKATEARRAPDPPSGLGKKRGMTES